ncbi:MAG: hypothetical protein R8J84_02585 [Mariprofundales bacterium]
MACIAQYNHHIDAIQQLETPPPVEELRGLEQQNRRMIQMLNQAMGRTQEDITDVTQAINRLERGKQLLSTNNP